MGGLEHREYLLEQSTGNGNAPPNPQEPGSISAGLGCDSESRIRGVSNGELTRVFLSRPCRDFWSRGSRRAGRWSMAYPLFAALGRGSPEVLGFVPMMRIWWPSGLAPGIITLRDKLEQLQRDHPSNAMVCSADRASTSNGHVGMWDESTATQTKSPLLVARGRFAW